MHTLVPLPACRELVASEEGEGVATQLISVLVAQHLLSSGGWRWVVAVVGGGVRWGGGQGVPPASAVAFSCACMHARLPLPMLLSPSLSPGSLSFFQTRTTLTLLHTSPF